MTDRDKHDPNRPESTPDTPKRDEAEVDQEEKVTPQGAEMDEVQERAEGDQIAEDTQRYLDAEEVAQEVRRSGRKEKDDPSP